MKVIILCGGTGTRLKEETQFKPKSMVEVAGKPIVLHIMNHFMKYGYNDFILTTGLMGNQIKEYFLNFKQRDNDLQLNLKTGKIKYFNKLNLNFKVTLLATGSYTKTAERILMCAKYIPKEDEDFMVCYADGLASVDFKKFHEFHKKTGLAGTVLCAHPRSKYGKIHVDEKGVVVQIEEKPIMSDWTNAGFMVYKRKALKYFSKDEMDFVSLDKMAKDRQLAIFKHTGFWYAVDTYKELEDLNKIVDEKGKVWEL